jgi:leader peptidase (prepilin peptidase) / N-methyltransferase
LAAEVEDAVSVALPTLLIALQAACGCLLVALVVTMALIDCRDMILPNSLNATLAACGIGQSVFVGQPGIVDAALGALTGFVVFAGVAALFRRLRGIDGLGLGDQKFAAAAGLWIGWEGIAPMLLIASGSALVFVLIRAARQRSLDLAGRIPFGPFLGFGTTVCWLVTVASGA